MDNILCPISFPSVPVYVLVAVVCSGRCIFSSAKIWNSGISNRRSFFAIADYVWAVRLEIAEKAVSGSFVPSGILFRIFSIKTIKSHQANNCHKKETLEIVAIFKNGKLRKLKGHNYKRNLIALIKSYVINKRCP